MDATVLAADIVSRWIANPNCGFTTPEHPVLTEAQQDIIQAQADAVAEAVVSHIQNFAVVNVASVSGVTTGGGISGPGTGTIS